jgi:hypothetical protein
MSLIDRFQAYADAFEVAFEKDDWSVLEPYFTADAVYETRGGGPFDGRAEGRGKLIDYLKQSVSGFDRRFDERILEMTDGPEERDGQVWMRWRATYRVGDAPEIAIEGESTAHYDGDRIRLLEDAFAEGASDEVLAWMGRHAGKLRPI